MQLVVAYAIYAEWLRHRYLEFADRPPMASRMKSRNIKSTTGRKTVMAAPQHMPTKPRSLMGVAQPPASVQTA